MISAILHSPVPLNSDSTSYGKSSEGLAAAFLVPRALEGLALRNLYPNEPLSTRCLGAQRHEGSDQIYVYEWADPFWHAACPVLRQLVTGPRMQVMNWMARGPVCVGSRDTLATAEALMTAGSSVSCQSLMMAT